MAVPCFCFIRIIFTIFFVIMLEAANVRAQTTTSKSSATASSTPTSYATEINNGELGIKIKLDWTTDTKMNVVISYDTETQSATDFFKTQLTADVFQGFSGCNVINWNFMPCGTSKLNGNDLYCPNGPDQCKYDKIHACVATLYAQDQLKVGGFIICFFNNNKDFTKCIADNGLIQNNVDQCVQNAGAFDCDRFYNIIHGTGSQQLLSASASSTGSANTDGTLRFKSVLCEKLINSQLTCNFCSSN